MTTSRLRLGQLLVDARLITPEALEDVLTLQRRDGRRLGTLLVERGHISEVQLTQILSHQLSVPWVSLLKIEFSRQLLNLVPRQVAERYGVLPIFVRRVRGQGDTLYIATDDPTNEEALRECGTHAGLPVRAMIAPPSDVRGAIRAYYGGPPDAPAAAGVSSAAVTEPVPERASTAPATTVEPASPPVAAAPVADVPRPPDAVTITTPDAPRPIASPAPHTRTLRSAVFDEPLAAAEIRPAPSPRGQTPRMVSLTLLDGTTLTLPARPQRRPGPTAVRAAEEAPAPGPSTPHDGEPGVPSALTARDLIAALRVVANGADASAILGDEVRWEAMFAALLSVLLKKHLIADWEFVEELSRLQKR